MNPMVFTIAVRENEVEIQREVEKRRRSRAGAIQVSDPGAHQESHTPVFAWISRIRKRNPQPVCECS